VGRQAFGTEVGQTARTALACLPDEPGQSALLAVGGAPVRGAAQNPAAGAPATESKHARDSGVSAVTFAQACRPLKAMINTAMTTG
jgi:hypothetical protein